MYKGLGSPFNYLIEDLNWRILQNFGNEIQELKREFEDKVFEKIGIQKHGFMRHFSEKLKNVFNMEPLDLSIIDGGKLFNNSYFSEPKNGLPASEIGSGYEYIYSLIFLETYETLGLDKKDKVVVIIDEPELHLHPKFQDALAKYLFELSQKENFQVFVATHSPIFFKNLFGKTGVKMFVTKKKHGEKAEVIKFDLEEKYSSIPITWGLINYVAFNYPTVEFHNELYGLLMQKSGKTKISEFDDYLHGLGISKIKTWINDQSGKQSNCTLPTFIRNKIHHPENRAMESNDFSYNELEESIDLLIKILNNFVQNDSTEF